MSYVKNLVCFKCDRCGVCFDGKVLNNINDCACPSITYVERTRTEYINKTFKTIDLCPSCNDQFNNWLNILNGISH